MARNIEIEINEVTYTGQTASAKDQIEMLQIAARNGLFPALADNVTDMALFASMASLDKLELEKLRDLVLNKGGFRREDDNLPVAPNMFQDRAHFYLLLIGKALKENIGPFWLLMENKSEEGTSAMSQAENANQQ